MKLVASACIIEKERLLLAKRYSPDKPNIHGKWEMPGGKVKKWESVEDALIRELLEELGCKLVIGRLIHCQVNDYGREPNAVLFLECASKEFQIPKLSKEVSKIEWVDLSAVGSFDTLPGTLEAVEVWKGA